jgi:hypothetical protein
MDAQKSPHKLNLINSMSLLQMVLGKLATVDYEYFANQRDSTALVLLHVWDNA